MNRLDLVVLVIVASAALIGWQMGFARRVLSWVGLLGGLAAAAWLLPQVLAAEEVPAGPSRFIGSAAILLGGAFVGQIIGTAAGMRIRGALGRSRLGRVDAGLGSAAGVLGVVLLMWIVLPAMADVPGWPAREARGSTFATVLHDTLGDPPGVLDNLAASLGLEGLPRVFEDLQAAPDVATPPTERPVGGAPLLNATASTLKVLATACERLQSGSGFVVAPGLVVTNAHVVAGSRSVRVETADGTRAAADVVAFDADGDLAVLRARSLDRGPLPLSDAGEGDAGVVLGFPGGGPLTVEPFVVGSVVRAEGRDIYDERRVSRRVLVLGATLAAGNSGGPLVDADGEVVGVAFAIAPDRAEVAYAIATDQVRDVVALVAPEPVGTGRCLR